MGASTVFFVDDPGAANFIAGVACALRGFANEVRLLARGAGATQLAALGEPFEEAPCRPSDVVANAPSLVGVGTSEDPRTFGLKLIDAARAARITTIGWVDGPTNVALRFRGSAGAPLASAPDYLITADAGTADSFVRLGMEKTRVFACGHPLYDRLREETARIGPYDRSIVRREVLPDAPVDRAVVTFLAERSDGIDPSEFRRSSEYTLHGRGGSDLRTDIVIEEFLNATAGLEPSPYRVLRLHPKNNSDEFTRFELEFDSVSGGGTPWALFRASDAVVGMTSAAMVEAALLGRPTLSILPRLRERDWLITAAGGITPSAFSRDQIGPALRAALDGGGPDPVELDRLLPAGATARIVRLIGGWIAGKGGGIGSAPDHSKGPCGSHS